MIIRGEYIDKITITLIIYCNLNRDKNSHDGKVWSIYIYTVQNKTLLPLILSMQGWLCVSSLSRWLGWTKFPVSLSERPTYTYCRQTCFPFLRRILLMFFYRARDQCTFWDDIVWICWNHWFLRHFCSAISVGVGEHF